MQIEYIHTICTKLLQGFVELLFNNFGFVSTSCAWVPFGGDRQATLLPFCFARESFLGATNVNSGCINLAVTGLLEFVKNGIIGVEGGYASAFLFIRTASEEESDGGNQEIAHN